MGYHLVEVWGDSCDNPLLRLASERRKELPYSSWSATILLSMTSSERQIFKRPTSGPIAAATASWPSLSAWSCAVTFVGPFEPPYGRRLLSFARVFISGFNSSTVVKGSCSRWKLFRFALHSSERLSEGAPVRLEEVQHGRVHFQGSALRHSSQTGVGLLSGPLKVRVCCGTTFAVLEFHLLCGEGREAGGANRKPVGSK
ncbi:hypothetical protein IscW_ISCW011233 [Ixodes scapularis]|uniref:Uncharacterized protein n=1 Tax=Ixodes scapularis TaxID=6945 RepID=B7Q850_IXOSC|nr:hypothetical protein IscW_ISCW011233 [Ixodes scapularis]|eukprot:XP_002412286.1 hypothetical protein IscW_ISCW011233 [Ixodes scapularis]